MSFNKDAKIHKLQEENDRLRRERTSYKLDKEAYRGTIEKLKKELDSLEEQLYLWEDVPDEDLWEDGELDSAQAQHKIIKHVLQIGDWKLMRRIEK